MTRNQRVVAISFPKLLLEELDIIRGDIPRSRFFARLLIINFPNQFLGDKANPYLIEELTTPEEMSALLSLILIFIGI
jgi:hypothetical protein